MDYITILAGLLIFVIIATVVRKSVKSPGWPYCRTCLEQRRRDLGCMWIGILLIVPGMVALGPIGNALGPDGTGLAMLAMVLVVVGLPIVAVVFGVRGSLERISGAQVSADGLLVSVPDSVYPDPSAAQVASAMGLRPAASYVLPHAHGSVLHGPAGVNDMGGIRPLDSGHAPA